MERRARASGAADGKTREQRPTRPSRGPRRRRASRGRSWSRQKCSAGGSQPISLPRRNRAGRSPARYDHCGRRHVGRRARPPEPVPRPTCRDRRASLEARPLAGDHRGFSRDRFAWMRTHLGSALLWGPRMIARHLAVAPRLARRLALAAFAAAIPITVVIASQSGTRHSSSERKVRAAGLLGAPGTDALSASSNPLAQRAAQHDRAPHHVRRIHARRTTRAHRRPHPATKHVVVAARYTPSTSSTASYTPSSTSSSYASSGSTPVSSQSTGGATTSSSSSGSSRPAFGEHGILGPGRGAANTQ